MELIPFADLGARSCALVDAGSLDTFLDPLVMRWASTDDFVRYAENRRNDGWSPERTLQEVFALIGEHPKIKETLLFLEKLVVYENLVFDAVSIRQRFADPAESPVLLRYPALRATAVPESVYADAHATIAASRPVTWQVLSRLTRPDAELRESIFVTLAGDEDFHDELFRTPHLRRYAFAESTDLNAVERAIFYQCVARAAGVPLALGAAKSEQLNRWNRRIAAELNDLIQKAVADNVRAQLQEMQEAIVPVDLQFPPISHRIVSRAIETGCTFFEAALELRDTVEARGYRQLLHELQRLAGGGPADRVRVGQILARVRAYHGDWLKADIAPAGPEGGHEATLKLAPLLELADLILPPQALPVLLAFKAIALAAEAAGLDEIRLILPPDRSAGVRFISSWYRYPS